eukprot:3627256-Pleurochrysis_carterae.AAC.1
MASAMGSGADPEPGHRPGPLRGAGLKPTAPLNLHTAANCPDHPNSSHRSSPILSTHMQQKVDMLLLQHRAKLERDRLPRLLDPPASLAGQS